MKHSALIEHGVVAVKKSKTIAPMMTATAEIVTNENNV